MVNVYITSGAVKYVGGTLYELTGKDISGDTFVMGLSSNEFAAPTIWGAPDVSTSGTAALNVTTDAGVVTIPTFAQRVLKLLVSSTLPTTNVPAVGSEYFVWAKVSDSPEVEPVILQRHVYFK